MNQGTPHLFQVGDWRADANQNLLWQAEQEVHLEPKAMAILQYLVLHANEVISRETLFAEFWTNQVVTEDALNRPMWNIRKTLGDTPNCPQYIATLRNQGYKLVAPVTFLKDPRIKQHQELLKTSQDNHDHSITIVDEDLSKNKSSDKKWYKSIINVLAILLFVFFIVWQTFNHKQLNNEPADLKRHTYDLAQNIMPSYSPNGEDLVYIAKSNKNNKLMYRESDKTYAYPLGNRESSYSYPTFGHKNNLLAVIAQNDNNVTLSIIDLVTKNIDDILILPQSSLGLSWHPEQNLLAYSQPHPLTHKHVIYTVHNQLKFPKPLTDTGLGIKDSFPRFSPSGEKIAFIRQFSHLEHAIFIVDLKGNTRKIGMNHNKIISFTWLDNQTLILSLTDGLYRLSLSGELTKFYTQTSALTVSHINYNTQLEQLVFSQEQNSSQITNFSLLQNKKEHLLTKSQANDIEGVTSKNGENLAFVTDRNDQLHIWLMKNNVINPIEGSNADAIFDLRWSDDNNKLAAISKTRNEYFLMVYQINSKALVKISLGLNASNLVDWQAIDNLLISQRKEDNWKLYQYDTTSKQIKIYNQINSIQARLSPDKRQLVFTKQQNSALWAWNFNDLPYLINNTEKLALDRNWFIDNTFLYFFTNDNNNQKSQLWRLPLAEGDGEQELLGLYPLLDNSYRSQKLIYTFAATHHQIISGDIWTFKLNQNLLTLN